MHSKVFREERQDNVKETLPYEDRCQLLKWPILSNRRTYLSLVECYKLVFGYYHLKFEDYFELATSKSTRERTIPINFLSNLQD